MNFVVQVGGVMVLGALLGLLMSGSSSSLAVTGVIMVAVATTGVAFWAGAWSTGKTFIANAGTSPSIHEANVAAGSLFPADENLLEASDLALPPNARVFLICESNSVGCSGEWISYRLSPRLFVEHMREAQYVLVYGDSPTTVRATAHLPLVFNRADGGVVRTSGT